ncbi:MAG: response regulator [Candidatus Omnitrophica bacterium]|nr:response regulator [Candidatus Omnitrophota bacterium]
MEKKKILIVDDEEHFLKLIKINLEKTDKYEVLTLSDAKDIILRIREFKPEVILLDILMPKIDGIEVCQMLNEDPGGKGIPIITLSALDTDKDKLMMYKLGVVDFLVKPIETDDLISKIEKALLFK